MKYANRQWLALCFFIALSTSAYSQDDHTTWEFGTRAGFNYQHLSLRDTRQSAFAPQAGIYATAYYNKNWALRNEIGWERTYSKFNNRMTDHAVFGVFPRYMAGKHLGFELGLEARKAFNNRVAPNEKIGFSIVPGVVWRMPRLEFNLRYSAGYQPRSPFSRGGWMHNMTVGISVPLWRKK